MSFQALPCEPKCSQCQPGSHAIPIVERSRTCDKQFARWLEGIEYTLYVAKCVEPLLLGKNLPSSSRKSKSHLEVTKCNLLFLSSPHIMRAVLPSQSSTRFPTLTKACTWCTLHRAINTSLGLQGAEASATPSGSPAADYCMELLCPCGL